MQDAQHRAQMIIFKTNIPEMLKHTPQDWDLLRENGPLGSFSMGSGAPRAFYPSLTVGVKKKGWLRELILTCEPRRGWNMSAGVWVWAGLPHKRLTFRVLPCVSVTQVLLSPRPSRFHWFTKRMESLGPQMRHSNTQQQLSGFWILNPGLWAPWLRQCKLLPVG